MYYFNSLLWLSLPNYVNNIESYVTIDKKNDKYLCFYIVYLMMHMQILLIICHDFLSDNVIWVNNIGECVNHKYGSSFCNTQLKNRITDDRVIFKNITKRGYLSMPLKISLIFSNFFFTYQSSINIFWKIEFDIKLVEMTTHQELEDPDNYCTELSKLMKVIWKMMCYANYDE